MKKKNEGGSSARHAKGENVAEGQHRADSEIAGRAEAEGLAQLQIIRALKPLSTADRIRILSAINLLMQADELVPGIFQSLKISQPESSDAGPHAESPSQDQGPKSEPGCKPGEVA